MSDKPHPPTNVVPLGRPAKTLTPDAVASSTRWLTAWTPAEPVPPDAQAQLPLVLASAESAIAPASVQGFAVAMDALVQWLERFAVIAFSDDPQERKRQITDIVRGYRDALSDLPADLLMRAVTQTTQTHRFRNLPMPADIRVHAEAELAERKARFLRLKTAAQVAERQRQGSDRHGPRERSPEQLAAAAAMVAEVARIDASPKAMPSAVGDLAAEGRDDRREAVRRVAAETTGMRRIRKPWEASSP